MTDAERVLPLFPLDQVVLFPGMSLPLHIFEDRYKVMIGACQVTDRLFGVLLIRSGSEVGALELLMRRAGQVVSKRALEDTLYGLSGDVNPNTVEVLISRLRKRLDDIGADCSIHTLRGIGYLLRE